MNILENLWFGNILPSEQFVDGNLEYKRAGRALADAEQVLLDRLPPELKPLLTALTTAQMQLNVVAERAAFAYGFRLATQLIISSLGELGNR